MSKLNLTAKELELIEAIRNYKRSYPNWPDGRWYIDQLLAELLDE